MRGSSSTKVTRPGSGWPAAWTESPPTSSPRGVATTTNHTRGRGWTTPGHRRPPRPEGQEGRHRRREDAARRAQARAARRPRGPGEAASHGPGLSPQPVAASLSANYRAWPTDLAARGVIWQKVTASPGGARSGGASASCLTTAAFAMLRKRWTGPSPPEEQHR